MVRPRKRLGSRPRHRRHVFVHISAVERADLQGLVEGHKIKFDVVNDPRKGKSSADNLEEA